MTGARWKDEAETRAGQRRTGRLLYSIRRRVEVVLCYGERSLLFGKWARGAGEDEASKVSSLEQSESSVSSPHSAEMASALKQELKVWEAAFRAEHGRDPTKQDIKQEPEIGPSLSPVRRLPAPLRSSDVHHSSTIQSVRTIEASSTERQPEEPRNSVETRELERSIATETTRPRCSRREPLRHVSDNDDTSRQAQRIPPEATPIRASKLAVENPCSRDDAFVVGFPQSALRSKLDQYRRTHVDHAFSHGFLFVPPWCRMQNQVFLGRIHLTQSYFGRLQPFPAQSHQSLPVPREAGDRDDPTALERHHTLR